jgi:sulfatase modifying factor 1
MRWFLCACVAVSLSAGSAWAEGRKLAIVVGVGTYRGNSGLGSLGQAPENDAVRLGATLQSLGFTVYEMTHSAAKQPGQEKHAPNIAYIRDQIAGVLGYPNLGPDDAVIIALHGHGVQFPLVDAEGGKTPKFYFCPADATIAGLETANQVTAEHYLLPLDQLYADLAGCTAATKLLIVDACRNDPNDPVALRSGLASASLPKLPPPPGGTVAFFSCRPNQQAIQDTERGEGIFTRFLIEGLNGAADQPLANGPPDGIVTFGELSTYVANNTYAHVLDKYKVRQSPELLFGELDLNLPLARVAISQEGKQAGEVRSFTDLGVKFCWCPAGSFTMGSPASETDRSSDEEQVSVMLSHGFWLGQMEVTQGLYQSVWTATRGFELQGDANYRTGREYPLAYISWDEATAFCRMLTERERAAGRLPSGWEYQLPTEAQWEYACRAGTTTAYSFDSDAARLSDYGWWGGFSAGNAMSEPYAHTVGTKQPNAWGLLDMHGNLYEWCQDRYGEDLPGGRDPVVSSGRSDRVLRGGGWNSASRGCRSAYRDGGDPSHRDCDLGFRVALSAPRE